MLKVFDTPWKLQTALSSLIATPWSRFILAINGVTIGTGSRFFGVPIIQKHRLSEMTLGAGLQLRSTASSNPLGAHHPVILCTFQAGAKLHIGKNFGMTGGTICCADRIMIGDDVTVGANSTIVDTDFHPLNPDDRKLHPQDANTAPIVIEDDVFIGMNCLVLKGVTIGKGSVIGAGSVVTRSVPCGVIAAGNPARVIRQIE